MTGISEFENRNGKRWFVAFLTVVVPSIFVLEGEVEYAVVFASIFVSLFLWNDVYEQQIGVGPEGILIGRKRKRISIRWNEIEEAHIVRSLNYSILQIITREKPGGYLVYYRNIKDRETFLYALRKFGGEDNLVTKAIEQQKYRIFT